MPEIFGDGVHDDTAGIQSALDTRAACVRLPTPRDHFLISRPLVIHSHQTLVLDRYSRIRLAPGSDCLMITNDDHQGGNAGISLEGGIWDMDNTGQSPNPWKLWSEQPRSAPQAYCQQAYSGILMRFVNVCGFSMQGMTLRNPVTFSTQFAKLSHFRIHGIHLEQDRGNPTLENMDGIHLDGDCRFGSITDIHGTTYDDCIALNADDLNPLCPHAGPIEDIVIDGVYCQDCHSAVRLLSSGSLVRRISIRNLFGSYYQYAIAVSNFFHAARGRFDSLVFENLFISKAPRRPEYCKGPTEVAPCPLIWVEKNVTVGSLSIRELHRQEQAVAVASIQVSKGACVDRLVVEGATVAPHAGCSSVLIANQGEIGSLSLRDIAVASAGPGGVIASNGVIRRLVGGDTGLPDRPFAGYAALPQRFAALDAGVLQDYVAGHASFLAGPGVELVREDSSGSGCSYVVGAAGGVLHWRMLCGSGADEVVRTSGRIVCDGPHRWTASEPVLARFRPESLRLVISGSEQPGPGAGELILVLDDDLADHYRVWVCAGATPSGAALARVIIERCGPWRQARTLLSLAEGWRFALDPDAGGESRSWHRTGPTPESQPISISRRWTDQGFAYHGTAWYTTGILVPDQARGASLWLVFQAVDGAARVWIDGRFIGGQSHVARMWNHAWALEVPSGLVPGSRALLVVEVSKDRYGAGIYGPVELRVLDAPTLGKEER